MNELDYLYDSFARSLGLPVALLSLALGFVLWIFKSSDCMPLWASIPTISLLLMILFVFYDSLRASIKSKRMPKVRSAKESSSDIEGPRRLTLLVDPSDLFYINTMVTLYGQENDFEIQIGLGYVETINDKKFIQVLVFEEPAGVNDEFWRGIAANKIDYLARLRLRPSVPSSYQFIQS
jgi:hypothetical protein